MRDPFLIDAITSTTLSLPFDRPVANASFTWHHKSFVFVEVRLSGGAVGIGESMCDLGEPAAISETINSQITPHLIGKSAFELAGHRSEIISRGVLSGRPGTICAALSGVDIAVWDALGRAMDLPVCALLGNRAAEVAAYASGGLYSPEDGTGAMSDCVSDIQARGFRDLKLKIGGADLQEDLARVAEAHEALGGKGRLMFDAMFSLSRPEAVRVCRALKAFDPIFLEAPLPQDDVEGWAHLTAQQIVPIAGMEMSAGLRHFGRLARLRAVDILQFDVTLAGGLSEGLDICALARAHNTTVSLHQASSIVALAASAHLAAARPEIDGLEFHLMHDWFHDLPHGWDLKIENGKLRMPDAPGLGLNLTLADVVAAAEQDSVSVASAL